MEMVLERLVDAPKSAGHETQRKPTSPKLVDVFNREGIEVHKSEKLPYSHAGCYNVSGKAVPWSGPRCV